MKEDLGKFIKEQRKKLGLTQKELALKLNVSDKAVSKWELGDSLPDIGQLKPLSILFGISIDELLDQKIVQKKDDKKDINKIVLFNLAANLVLIILIILFIVAMFFNPVESSSVVFEVVDYTTYSTTILIIMLVLILFFTTVNLLQLKQKKGDINEKVVTK